MKDKKTKDKALGLYIEGNSLEKIGKNLSVGLSSVKIWKKKYNWDEIREKTIQKATEKSPEIYSKIISDQVEISDLAQTELTNRLRDIPKVRKQIKELEKVWAECMKASENRPAKDDIIAFVQGMASLNQKLMFDKDIITIFKHALEVVRPKAPQNQSINFTKENNLNFNFDMTKIQESIRNGIPHR